MTLVEIYLFEACVCYEVILAVNYNLSGLHPRHGVVKSARALLASSGKSLDIPGDVFGTPRFPDTTLLLLPELVGRILTRDTAH